MMTFTREKLEEHIRTVAEGCRDSVKEHFDIDFDFSPKSLQLLDQVLANYHPDGFLLDAVVYSYATYVGEVVRQSLGGNWILDSGETQGVSLRMVGGKATIYPVMWMTKRLESLNQSHESSSLAYNYQRLLEWLGREDERPETIPVDLVASGIAKLHPPRVSDGEHVDEEEDEIGEDEQFSDDELLRMAPVFCFVLIACADGKMDAKEGKAFYSVIEKYLSHKDPIVREIFAAVPARFASDLEKVFKLLEKSGALAIPLKLSLCGLAARSKYPDNADAYCKSLIEMANTVAASSGGWFGFGGRIDKQERKMLDLISAALSLGKK